MKINDFSRMNAMQLYQKQSQRTTTQEPAKKVQFDKLELSNEAKEKLNAEREAKVQSLKEQIQNGTYTVNSEKIAEKLLSLWEKEE
jgi:negative regulator of flagellin synthesis FlgM